MKLTIQKIDILDLAKLSSVVYAFFGILGGMIFLTISFFDGKLGEDGLTAVITMIAFTIFFPIIYAVAGFATGAVLAYLFNKTTNFLGGLTIEATQYDDKRNNKKGGTNEKIMA